MAGDGIVTPGNFASQLLASLGLPTTAPWQNVIAGWAHIESNNPSQWRNNNPLNAKCSPQHKPFGVDVGVIGCDPGNNTIIFANLDAAVQSYSQQIRLPGTSYSPILKASSPDALQAAIIASKWDAGHYNNGKAWPSGGVTSTSDASGGSPVAPTSLGDVVGDIVEHMASGGPPGLGLITDVILGKFSVADILTTILSIIIGLALVLKGLSALTGARIGTIAKVAVAGGGIAQQAGRSALAPSRRAVTWPPSVDAPSAPEPSTPVVDAIVPSPSAAPPQADVPHAEPLVVQQRRRREPPVPQLTIHDFLAAADALFPITSQRHKEH